jgi:hypothetical protein
MELLKAMQEMTETRTGSPAPWMDILQVKTGTNQAEMLARMKAKMDVHQHRTEAKMDAWLEEMKTQQNETTACQEVTKVCLESKEPASMEIKVHGST